MFIIIVNLVDCLVDVFVEVCSSVGIGFQCFVISELNQLVVLDFIIYIVVILDVGLYIVVDVIG